MSLTEQLALAATDKQTTHSYGPLYEEWLAPLRHRPITLVEFGVSMFGGGELLCFADFLPLATIHGYDIDLKPVVTSVWNEPRIHLHECDVYQTTCFPSAEVMIDDCQHSQQSQIDLLQRAWRFVSPGGLYIIEDVRPENWLPLATTIREIEPEATFSIHDLRGEKQCGDDIIIAIRKPRIARRAA